MKRLLKPLIPARARRLLRSVQHRIASDWKRRFSAHYCPVCEEEVGTFNPLDSEFFEQETRHGFPSAEHDFETLNSAQYSCPRCGASDRNRLYALYLYDRLMAAPPGFRLIEFAPTHDLRTWIQRRFKLDYRSADLFMEGVDDRVDLADMRIYPECSVDAFICSHILEHVPDDRQAMRELFRILKPGGWGILMAPVCLRQAGIFEDASKATTEADRWRYFGQGDHLRIYDKPGFLARLAAAGFRMESIPASGLAGNPLRYGITERSVLYVGHKDRRVQALRA